MTIHFSLDSNFKNLVMMVATTSPTLVSSSSLDISRIHVMATSTTLVHSPCGGGYRVEAKIGQSLGASMENGCNYGSLPSNGNLDKASFYDIMKNVSHPSTLN